MCFEIGEIHIYIYIYKHTYIYRLAVKHGRLNTCIFCAVPSLPSKITVKE